MGAGNRMRVKPVSVEVINRHNTHTGITYPELMEERERAERQRRLERQRKQRQQEAA